MATIEKNGAPGMYTEGDIGDLYTDLITGDQYECVSITKFGSDATTNYLYMWRLIDNGSGDVDNEDIAAAVQEYLKENPIEGITVDTELDETSNNAISNATVAKEISQLSEEIEAISSWSNDRIMNIAHRGAMPTEAPENTLVGYAKAKEMGFDYVEVDVRLTSDGEIVMLHDATINATARNTDGTTISDTVNIADITLEQAKEYVFCSSLYASYPSVRIPTLEETVTLCKRVGLKIHFDMYVEPTTELLDTMFAILDEYDMRDNVIWGSSTYNYVYAVKNYYAKANIYTRSSTYSDTDSMLSGLANLKTGQNRVVVAVRLESMETYAPLLHENGYDVIFVTPTKEDFISVYKYVDAVMSEDYLASEYLVEYMLTSYGTEVIEPEAPLLNLNRTEGTQYAGSNSENIYINPASYDTLDVSTEADCTITNLTSNSITVTENGVGGRGVAFPLFVYSEILGIDRRGKSYTLTWDATGTVDTRFRLMMCNTTTLKHADLDSKNGTLTSATIVISTDGKTITVNGTDYTFDTVISWMAFFFGAATGKTVGYTGVTLVEN